MLPFLNFALFKKRNDVADIMWGLSFIAIGWSTFYYNHNKSHLALVVNILVSIWGLRLSYHIGRRWFRFKEEERRYADMRANWKKNQEINSFFLVFLLQAILAVLVSIPVILINTYAVNPNVYAFLGVVLWLFGFIYESTADMQLKKFATNPDNNGKIMETGLFKLSRHPNYFGELSQWWGITIMSLFVSYGYIGILGAFTITFLINKVSGVPLSEKRTSQKPGWAEYISKTPPIIPKLF